MALHDALAQITNPTLAAALPLLVPLYGERTLTPCPDNLSELIYTILSHRTNKADEQEAFRRMQARFPTWQAVEAAPLTDLIETLALSRFPERKAPYIQGTLRAVREYAGAYTLDFLRDMTTDEAMRWLLALPGVGLKTASLVMLFCLHRPVLPVDTHVHRVSTRLAIIPPTTSQEAAHARLLRLCPPDAHLLYNLHKLFFKHGQMICTFSAPRCDRCVLLALCPTGQATMARRIRISPPAG